MSYKALYRGGINSDNQRLVQYVMDSNADFSNLPASAPVGAIAFTADGSKHYRKNPTGNWVEYSEGGGGASEFVATFSYNDDEEIVCDKTLAEINAALSAGQICKCVWIYSDTSEISMSEITYNIIIENGTITVSFDAWAMFIIYSEEGIDMLNDPSFPVLIFIQTQSTTASIDYSYSDMYELIGRDENINLKWQKNSSQIVVYSNSYEISSDSKIRFFFTTYESGLKHAIFTLDSSDNFTYELV